MPPGKKTVRLIEQFSGLCGYGNMGGSYPFATGRGGTFYVVSDCTYSVDEFKPGASSQPKSPIAVNIGGNLGQNSAYVTAIAVDKKGNLYVGDNGGGITFFAAESLTPVVLVATNHAGPVYELTVDSKDNVWSTVEGGATTYFDGYDCYPTPSGSVKRSVIGQEFANGAFVKNPYSEPEEYSRYAPDGRSIAVDDRGRVYVSAVFPGTVLDFPPSAQCSDPTLTMVPEEESAPQLVVDAKLNFYLTDAVSNTISVFKSGSTTPLKTVTQVT